jgi:TetR/AcrR family transcriptional repressor of multidrug resistance operon
MRLRDETKEALVKKNAIELIVKDGLDGFSMHKLAKAVKISPATLYIYYKDKEDLILKLGIEESEKMKAMTLKGFNPKMSFAEGMEIQWKNRRDYVINHSDSFYFTEQIRHSSLKEKIFNASKEEFSLKIGEFIKNAIANKELKPIPKEVYWSIAFAPLYNLLRFHKEEANMAGEHFILTEEIFKTTLEIVLKALKP